MKNTITVFTDGGSRGNPGPAAAGVYIVQGIEELFQGGKYLGETTNNIAEYKALILALNWLVINKEKVTATEIIFTLDSELIVKQLKGEYKVKDSKMKEMYVAVQGKLQELNHQHVFQHVLREKNKIADKIVNKVLDQEASK